MISNIFFSFIAILLAVSGCSQNSTTPISKSKYGKIIGLVRTIDGVPIPDAEISTTPPSEALISDINGKFVISSLVEGEYSVHAKKNGFKSKSVMVKVLISNQETQAIIILEENKIINLPPNKPTLIFPENNANISEEIKLKWDCSDPENDELHYDVFLGESISALNMLASNITTKEFLLSNLTLNKTYFWKIAVKDNSGNRTESEIFSFKFVNIVNQSDLVLFLNFDGSLVDRSPEMQYLSQYNISIVSDRFGKNYSAAYFSGTTFVSLDQPKSMDYSKPFTIALWIKPDVGYGLPYENEVDLVSRYGAASPSTSSFSFLISNSYLSGEVYKYNVGRNILKGNSIMVNEWQHVAFVYDGTNLKLYYNGTLASSKTTYQPDASNLPLLIGKRGTNNRFYKGYMDDLMIYKKALTSDEIMQLSK